MSSNPTPVWPRGSIIRIPKFAFDPRTSPSLKDGFKPKFCVLMECWDNGSQDILVVLTTSVIDKYAGQKGVVLIKKGTVSGLPEDSIVRCDSLRPLHKDTCFAKSELVGQLPEPILAQVVDKFRYTRLDPFLVLRAKGITLLP